METEKIKARFGQFEFEAEGPVELVQSQYDRFMNAVEKMVPSANSGASVHKRVVSDAPGVDDDPDVDLSLETGEQQSTDALINRVFRRDGDTLSLLALPQAEDGTAPDALVLLLYGYAKIHEKTSVSGYLLLKGARQSGISLDRVDDPLNKRREFVMAAGVRRGRTYTLNNRGVAYAEGVLRRLLN